ncbi:MAG: hypothetical protein ACTSUL_07300, partial [Promethearchaeota archaeon]
MNTKKVKIFLFTVILAISALPLNMNFSGIVKKVEAQSGPPYEIIKNPWINDTTYWEPQILNDADPESWITINQSGFTVYLKNTGEWNDVIFGQPYCTGHAVQGYQWAKGLPPKFYGQGLNHYIYIPVDFENGDVIQDGQLILKINATRLMDPELHGYLPDNPVVEFASIKAPLPQAKLGFDLWFAVKVRFWDDDDVPIGYGPGGNPVPSYMRGKEAYLGIFSTNVWGCPNNLIMDIFVDGWGWDNLWNEWKKCSLEYDDGTLDYPAFLGSTEDWDWHSSRVLYTIENIGQWEYHEIDLGKFIREFVQWQNGHDWTITAPIEALWDDPPCPWGRYWQFMKRPNRGDGCFHLQYYNIVGLTLVAVGVTSECVAAACKWQVNYVQLLDYRDAGGHPPHDLLFDQSINYWMFLYENGYPDPCCEHISYAMIPPEIPDVLLAPINATVTTEGGGLGQDDWHIDHSIRNGFSYIQAKVLSLPSYNTWVHCWWKWTTSFKSNGHYVFSVGFMYNASGELSGTGIDGNGLSLHLYVWHPQYHSSRDYGFHYEWKIIDNLANWESKGGIVESDPFNMFYSNKEGWIVELMLDMSAWHGGHLLLEPYSVWKKNQGMILTFLGYSIAAEDRRFDVTVRACEH